MYSFQASDSDSAGVLQDPPMRFKVSVGHPWLSSGRRSSRSPCRQIDVKLGIGDTKGAAVAARLESAIVFALKTKHLRAHLRRRLRTNPNGVGHCATFGREMIPENSGSARVYHSFIFVNLVRMSAGPDRSFGGRNIPRPRANRVRIGQPMPRRSKLQSLRRMAMPRTHFA
jgi:hypothetical protein